MIRSELLRNKEEAPHIKINQDGSTINLSNWNLPKNRNWSYRHVSEVFPYFKKIDKGLKKTHELDKNLVDLSSVSVHYRSKKMQFEEFLFESHCNGILVLKNNTIVYENYKRMKQDECHLAQSISKTSICAVIGDLIEDGSIDPQKPVEEYIPEIGEGFRGVKIQDVLDMNVALDFDENFFDPSSEVFNYEMISGFHPEKKGQLEGILPYLCNLKKQDSHQLDGYTNYLCPNTDLLGCIIERVKGKKFTALFQEKIFQQIGAEQDAYFLTDAKGRAICSGGMTIRLRDLGRYGQLFANKGVNYEGKQVIPKRWIHDCLDAKKGTTYELGSGYKYHNQMTTNGISFCHLGVGGQLLYANTETKVVVAQFSTFTAPSNGDLDIASALYNLAESINTYLG